MAEISIIVSAIAGMGSFFSPCILPILPAFISYLSGTTLHEIGNINNTTKTSHLIMKILRLYNHQQQ